MDAGAQTCFRAQKADEHFRQVKRHCFSFSHQPVVIHHQNECWVQTRAPWPSYTGNVHGTDGCVSYRLASSSIHRWKLQMTRTIGWTKQRAMALGSFQWPASHRGHCSPLHLSGKETAPTVKQIYSYFHPMECVTKINSRDH